jgi:predicted transcriptional regulator
MAVHKVHRVFVIDEEQRPVKCIAQTDVLRNLLVPSGVEA